MQDFWLLNGFFVMLGLIYLIVALTLILRSKSRNSRNRSLTTLPSKSKKAIGYNLLITGLLISCTAGLLLIFGKLINLNLLVAAAINLTITLIAQRIQIFPAPLNESDPLPMSSNVPTVSIASPQEPDPTLKIPTPETELPAAPNSDRPRRPSVEISPEIYAELVEISSDPSAAVEEAIRWWLRRRLVDVNTDSNRPSLRSSESWRSQQNKWND